MWIPQQISSATGTFTIDKMCSFAVTIRNDGWPTKKKEEKKRNNDDSCVGINFRMHDVHMCACTSEVINCFRMSWLICLSMLSVPGLLQVLDEGSVISFLWTRPTTRRRRPPSLSCHLHYFSSPAIWSSFSEVFSSSCIIFCFHCHLLLSPGTTSEKCYPVLPQAFVLSLAQLSELSSPITWSNLSRIHYPVPFADFICITVISPFLS